MAEPTVEKNLYILTEERPKEETIYFEILKIILVPILIEKSLK